jgi:nicotinate dehydrogenase subunit B
VRFDEGGTVTVFTGKVELGQGIVTALARIAAEELELPFELVRVETADTEHGLDERMTAGSLSMADSGSALRQASAEVLAVLRARAAERLGVDGESLTVAGGALHSPDGGSIANRELVGAGGIGHRAGGRVAPRPSGARRIVGSPVRNRCDMRGLVTGATRFVSDLRHEPMAHGRVLRPPGPAAALAELDDAPVRALAGIRAIVRSGSFVGVIAEREERAVEAIELLARRARWNWGAPLPPDAGSAAWLRAQADQAFLILDGSPVEPAPPLDPSTKWTHTAAYTRPYLIHGSIGPSSAMALWQEGSLTVWSHSQGVYPLRDALADALGVGAAAIRVRHVPGPGCYGHNGADDAAFDAALLARVVPGVAVLLKWSRADEHQWEPFGPPALVELRATLSGDGQIADWSHDAWGTSHRQRPGTQGAPQLLAGPHLDPPLRYPAPGPFLEREAGIHRNATPIYDLPRQRIVKHFVAAMPLRTSSLRSLGAYANVFAIESFMDELAALARASPLEFRLRHLGDPRARAVLEAAAQAAAWSGAASAQFGRGAGIALARYKGSAAYTAVHVTLRVGDDDAAVALERITIAADCGEVVDPSGVANQLEGGALQSASWTLRERVRFDERIVTSVDWESYPILRFSDVPAVETVLLDRPGEPFLGTGEAAQGPTAAAIANALFDATGLRLRDTPLTPARIREAALGA